MATHLLRLTVPALTPEGVIAVLGADPTTLTEPQRAQQRDYADRLVRDGHVAPAPQLTHRLHELAMTGERAQRSLPTLPASAGQVIGLRADQLAQLRAADPQLADRVARDGVYVDLSGRPDLTPYVLPGSPRISLTGVGPAYDLTSESGRRALLWEDGARAYTTVAARYGGNPAAMALLSTHRFHYVADSRTMVLVPDVLTRALYDLAPAPPPQAAPETAPVATGPAGTHVYADRLTLPVVGPGQQTVRYGQPLDVRTGQPAPLWNSLPIRAQVQQGALGDCGMLATIAAVAGHHPDAIGRLLRPNRDGTVDVILHESTMPGSGTGPTGRRLRITVASDVPLRAGTSGVTAYADQSRVGAAWASTLEKALAAVDRGWSEERRQQWQSRWSEWSSPDGPHQAAPLGYARLNVGSTPDLWAEVFTQITGEPAKTAQFDPTVGREPATEATLAALLAAGNPVVVSTKASREYPPEVQNHVPYDLYAGHAYEVVGVANGHVQLRNPWNTDHPTPMPVRAFLDLMALDYAHLDRVRAPIPQPPGRGQPSRPAAPPVGPPTQDPRGSARVTSPAVGRVVIEQSWYTFAYYAVRSGGATVGLVAAQQIGDGHRAVRWLAGEPHGPQVMFGPLTMASGELWPVERPEAERVAGVVLGFVLPDEPELREMLGS